MNSKNENELIDTGYFQNSLPDTRGWDGKLSAYVIRLNL